MTVNGSCDGYRRTNPGACTSTQALRVTQAGVERAA